MFFIRKDMALLLGMKRRLKSSRAAVFAEFSFLAPVLVLFLSAMIELAAFWDSKVMATHTAWQIGRIASVRVHEEQTSDLSKIYGMTFGETYSDGISTNRTVQAYDGQYKVITGYLGVSDQMKTFGDVTAFFLMSTCGIGAFGEKYNEKVAEQSETLLVNQLGIPIDELKSVLDELIGKLGLDDESPDIGGWFDTLKDLVKKLIDTVVQKVLEPIIDFFKGILAPISRFVLDIDADAYDDNTWKHFAKRLSAAAVRVKRPEFKVECTIEDARQAAHGDGRVWSSGFGKKPPYSFTYPQSATINDERDRGWVKNANVWPPLGMKQSLVDVKVEWPYTGSWIFPVVSTLGTRGKVVTTRGYSRVYTQPAIENEFLLSRGATQYQQGVVEKKYDFADLDIGAFVRMMSFSMLYRMRAENVWRGENKGGGFLRKNCYLYDPFWSNVNAFTVTVGDEPYADWCRTSTTLKSAYENQTPYDKDVIGGSTLWSKRWKPFGTNHKNVAFYRKVWAYRNYFFWLDNTKLRLRYAGPSRCQDHKLCSEADGNDGGKGWGFKGTSEQMFFNTYDFLKLQVLLHDPDAQSPLGAHAQFETCAMGYDALCKRRPELCAREDVGDYVLPDSGGGDAFADLFRKTFRLNLRSAMYVYNGRSAAKDMIGTNLTMCTHAVKTNAVSLLRAQALDFSLGQYERMEELEKKAAGKSEEIEDDLVDQSGIDFINSDSDDAINNFKEWWANQQQVIKNGYDSINALIPVLKQDCQDYTNMVAAFEAAMAGADPETGYDEDSVLSELREDLKGAYEALQSAKPMSEDALIDAVFESVASQAADSSSGRTYQQRVTRFNDAYGKFRDAYEKFRLDIVACQSNEVAFAAAIGIETQHGSKPLDPEDIGGSDDPGDLPTPPGGDPTVSGNDPYPFGEKWKLTPDRGWERAD